MFVVRGNSNRIHDLWNCLSITVQEIQLCGRRKDGQTDGKVIYLQICNYSLLTSLIFALLYKLNKLYLYKMVMKHWMIELIDRLCFEFWHYQRTICQNIQLCILSTSWNSVRLSIVISKLGHYKDRQTILTSCYLFFCPSILNIYTYFLFIVLNLFYCFIIIHRTVLCNLWKSI